MTASTRYHKGDKIAGCYWVHQALRGGMGEVYLCLDLETYEPYALKTFQSRFLTNPTVRDLFQQEVAHWVALEKHPHIVRCIRMEILANQPFMMLEWVASDESHGADLRSWLRHGPLPLRLALQFALDICSGLTHAQEKLPGIVHRDLKPDNILIAQGEVAKITDWGLATLIEQAGLNLASSGEFRSGERQSLMQGGGVIGTPPYMAPEQWRAEKLDPRTDLYAVGCILYEMLAGRWPYPATSSAGFEQAHLTDSIPSLPSSLPSALMGIVGRCLAKERSERYRSAMQLAMALSEVYAEELGQVARVLPAGDEFDAGDYNNRGGTYNNLGQFERAIVDFDRAIALQPDNVMVYNNRGSAYADLGQSERAIADYNHAIALKPDYAIAYSNRGTVYDKIGEFERALEDYDHAIALEPGNATAYFSRGTAYLKTGQLERALDDYDRAIALKPDDANAYNNRGVAHDKMGQSERAIADFDRAIALQPDDADAYYNRGNVYLHLGQSERALDDYEQAIALKPDYATAYYNRGNIYREMGQSARALEDYAQAIALHPDFANAHVNKGALLANTGLLPQALVCFEQAERLGDPTGTQYAAQVRQMLGQSPVSID